MAYGNQPVVMQGSSHAGEADEPSDEGHEVGASCAPSATVELD